MLAKFANNTTLLFMLNWVYQCRIESQPKLDKAENSEFYAFYNKEVVQKNLLQTSSTYIVSLPTPHGRHNKG